MLPGFPAHLAFRASAAEQQMPLPFLGFPGREHRPMALGWLLGFPAPPGLPRLAHEGSVLHMPLPCGGGGLLAPRLPVAPGEAPR